jgi:hypothetical protein
VRASPSLKTCVGAVEGDGSGCFDLSMTTRKFKVSFSFEIEIDQSEITDLAENADGSPEDNERWAIRHAIATAWAQHVLDTMKPPLPNDPHPGHYANAHFWLTDWAEDCFVVDGTLAPWQVSPIKK